MNSDYKYTIDGKPYTYLGFIKQAIELGWEADSIRFTSVAAQYLKNTGHEVGYYKNESEVKK